jgi:predicted enzyme related to lactoylglutathione lyase
MAFVPVSDLARATVFYAETLGLEVRQGDDYGCMLRANGTSLRLAVVEGYDRPPFTVLGWEVADIATSARQLVDAGIVLHRYEGMGQDELGVWAAPSGDLVAWFPDSEGNTLSLTQLA